MSDIVIAYIPVLHEGYRRFLQTHAGKQPGRARRQVFLIGPSLLPEYRPLAKDVRALSADLIARAIRSWGIVSEIAVLDESSAHVLAAKRPSIVLPDEDVSVLVVERYFPRCEVRYATTFLRWDKSKTVRMLEVRDHAELPPLPPNSDLAELVAEGDKEAAKSVDWWRRVGAAMRLASGEIMTARNRHLPHEEAPYEDGDPRSNFYQGVHPELSTAIHAEASLIAEAACLGKSTRGAILYVTDFPCPTCAKLIAAAGILVLYYRRGYAMVDGTRVLREADVELHRLFDDDRSKLDGFE